MRRNLILALFVVLGLSACVPLTTSSTPGTAEAPEAAHLTAQARIERELASHPSISVGRSEGSLIIRLPAADGFATGSAEPTAELQAMLAELVPVLSSDTSTELLVLGHTDSIGSETYNLRLSIARAEAVMDVLRRLGIPLVRLAADGRGEAEPIADNATEEGRALNRRVEIVLRPGT